MKRKQKTSTGRFGRSPFATREALLNHLIHERYFPLYNTLLQTLQAITEIEIPRMRILRQMSELPDTNPAYIHPNGHQINLQRAILHNAFSHYEEVLEEFLPLRANIMIIRSELHLYNVAPIIPQTNPPTIADLTRLLNS